MGSWNRLEPESITMTDEEKIYCLRVENHKLELRNKVLNSLLKSKLDQVMYSEINKTVKQLLEDERNNK